jgi:Na+/glutamate symporter
MRLLSEEKHLISEEDLDIICGVASVILLVSAFIDLTLWFLIGYMVPSWTIAVMMLVFIVLLYCMKHDGHLEAIGS